MSQAPSMPMFWDAYLADTTHLSTEEHGAYLLLLAAMWRRNGWVPDDDKDNARILGLTVSKWRKVKARLSDFLVFEDGQISQKNLQKIWKNTQEKIQKNKENGAKGGRPKTKKNNDLTKANGFVSDNPNGTIPEPEPYIPPISPKGEADKPQQKPSRKNVTPSQPEDVPDQIWTDFLVHRKQKRAPVTQTVLDGFRREAGKANVTLSQAMALSCERGWQGFKAEWVKPGDVPKTEPQKPTRPVIQCNGPKYVDDVEALVKRFYETGYWEPSYGYRPDVEWTDVPGWMIEKYGGVDPRDPSQNIIQFQQDRKSGAA